MREKVTFDYWACRRNNTNKWGCAFILDRLIKEIDKPDIAFGKTDGINNNLDIVTVDSNPDVNPTCISDWKNLPFEDNQWMFGFWDPLYDHLYLNEYKEIWRVCKRLGILHQFVMPRPKNSIRTHMIAITTGPKMRIRCLQIFKKKNQTLKNIRKSKP